VTISTVDGALDRLGVYTVSSTGRENVGSRLAVVPEGKSEQVESMLPVVPEEKSENVESMLALVPEE